MKNVRVFVLTTISVDQRYIFFVDHLVCYCLDRNHLIFNEKYFNNKIILTIKKKVTNHVVEANLNLIGKETNVQIKFKVSSH